jgi:nucleoid-associated protein YgaU
MFLKNLKKQFTGPESYISLTLGFLIVLVAGLLVYNFFTKKGTQLGENTNKEEIKEEAAVDLPSTHTVAAGENLWTIAEKYYKSGYNWVTIAQANKLADADAIEIGQNLSLPKAETIKPQGEKILATATVSVKEYTVAKGDNLWKIAVEQTGNGYNWIKIAQENNLINPDVIHAGNVLKIPVS